MDINRRKFINTIILENLAEFDKYCRKHKKDIKEFYILDDLKTSGINITALNKSNKEVWKMSLSKSLLEEAQDNLKGLIDDEMERSWNLFITKLKVS